MFSFFCSVAAATPGAETIAVGITTFVLVLNAIASAMGKLIVNSEAVINFIQVCMPLQIVLWHAKLDRCAMA